MHLGEAQRDMRRAYVNGGVGIFASGLVWTLSGLVTMNISLIAGMATLFFGGMAIHPISVWLARSFYRRGKTRSPNPMETLALLSAIVDVATGFSLGCMGAVAHGEVVGR